MTNLQKTVLAGFAAAIIAACSSSSSPSTPTKAAAQKLYINYTAIGASDAVGYGSSQPCTTATPALGAADPTCPEPGAAGYVPDIRTGFAQYGFIASLQDLGISGAVIGPDIQAMGNMYDSTTCQPRAAGSQIPANFLQNELPNVNPAATFITIFAGGNDVNAIATGAACVAALKTQDPTTFITQQVTNFGNDFAELVGGVHAKAPEATIVIANIPNFANVPYAFLIGGAGTTANAEARAALQGISVAMDTDVINTVASKGIPVVDLQCNPASYDPNNFYKADGFHPNDQGYALLAQQFLIAALSNYPAAPQSSCVWQGLSPTPGATPPAPSSSSSVRFTTGTRLKFPVR